MLTCMRSHPFRKQLITDISGYIQRFRAKADQRPASVKISIRLVDREYRRIFSSKAVRCAVPCAAYAVSRGNGNRCIAQRIDGMIAHKRLASCKSLLRPGFASDQQLSVFKSASQILLSKQIMTRMRRHQNQGSSRLKAGALHGSIHTLCAAAHERISL